MHTERIIARAIVTVVFFRISKINFLSTGREIAGATIARSRLFRRRHIPIVLLVRDGIEQAPRGRSSQDAASRQERDRGRKPAFPLRVFSYSSLLSHVYETSRGKFGSAHSGVENRRDQARNWGTDRVARTHDMSYFSTKIR